MAGHGKRYGMLVNLNRCIGCYACQVSCKAEYKIPFGAFRCRVKIYQSGNFPDINKMFMPHLCNHCENAPCIEACSEGVLFRNGNGVVEINHADCTGCMMCMEKCPYNAIEINPLNSRMEKCDFCYSNRVIKGQQPVCVQSCIGKALLFGDINDPESEISKEIEKTGLKVLSPELGTSPSVFYAYKGTPINTNLKDYICKKKHQARSSPQTVDIPISDDINRKLVYTSDVMCPSECGIEVLVEDGIAKGIYGNPHTLVNNGTLCAKGASGLQLTYSPHRVRTPLVRTGQRGEDKWKEITWEEASDLIAKKLIDIKQKHGAESVFLDLGDVTDREAYYRLFHAFGTPNTYNHGSICDPNRKWGQWIMTGDERPLPDIQRPVLTRNGEGKLAIKKSHDIKLLLNIGANPFVATRFNYMSYGIPAAKEENGCIYIVVDPAHTSSAAHADIWLPITPGTDAAFLAAMLYFIITNDSLTDSSRKYIDHAFIKNYSTGWDKFRKSFLDQAEIKDPSNDMKYFSAEWAEEKTGITPEDINKVSHLFGITKPAAMEIGMHGTAHHTNGDITSILMTALCLITGNMDVPGGLVLIDSQKARRGNRTSGRNFLTRSVSRKVNRLEATGSINELNKDLYGDYPAARKGVLADLPSKIREGIKLSHGSFKGHTYPVKAFIARAGNPVISAGSTQDWIDALTSMDNRGNYMLDLMVFIDTHISVTGKYADIILPEAGFLERMGVSDVYTMSPEIALRDQVIKPLHQSKTPFEIMISISDALVRNGDHDIKEKDFGLKYKNEEDFIDEILSEAPGFYNAGTPLPYPELPEGCLIIGTPDNPFAVWGKKIIREGELLTAKWLRENNGVAVWPASYFRYKKSDGSPSGTYPLTGSGKFEFRFSYLEDINKKLGTDFPVTFYWAESRWNPKNINYKNMKNEYPFQIICGRVHYAMTMTTVCPYLAETETECMKPLNESFCYSMPEGSQQPESYGLSLNRENRFDKDSISIPVLAFNIKDGDRLGIKTGDVITLENPLKKRIRGKAYLSEEIRPGVIKTAFGPGGQNAPGLGLVNNLSEYTPNINEFFDPENLSPYTGMPGFGDMIAKVLL